MDEPPGLGHIRLRWASQPTARYGQLVDRQIRITFKQGLTALLSLPGSPRAVVQNQGHPDLKGGFLVSDAAARLRIEVLQNTLKSGILYAAAKQKRDYRVVALVIPTPTPERPGDRLDGS
jgi:hypothetical protein